MSSQGQGKLVLVASLFTCTAFGGCDREERKNPEWEAMPSESVEGPHFEDRDFVLEVGAPTPCEKEGALAPQAGFSRLSVPLTVEGSSSREVPVGALSFALTDAEGHRFMPTLAGCHPTIETTKLTAGTKAKGHVAFDVPDPNGRYELSFEPFVIGRKPIVARARVPRLEKQAGGAPD